MRQASLHRRASCFAAGLAAAACASSAVFGESDTGADGGRGPAPTSGAARESDDGAPLAPVVDAAPDPSSVDVGVACDPLTACVGGCVDTVSDPLNCGGCGRTCVVANASAACVEGRCAIGTCARGFSDADGDPENGCEFEAMCAPGGACETACGSAGRLECSSGAPACAPPEETCDAADEDCDGACDEGPVVGCRVGVHRGQGNGHVYTTELEVAQSPPFQLESSDYFFLYAEQAPGTSPVYLCLKPNGKRFLTGASNCEFGAAPERTLGFWTGDARCGAIPLYRLYSGAAGNHFYTTSAPERDNAVSVYGYVEEGIAAYVWPSR